MAGFAIQGPYNSANVIKASGAEAHLGPLRDTQPAHLPDAPANAALCTDLNRVPFPLQSDVPSCKGYIALVDAVLLPFDPAVPLPTDFTAAGAMLGAAGCAVQPNALIRGTQVLAGESNRQATIGDCCNSCAATSGCNAWRYCSQKGGCPMPNGAPIPYGFCALLSSPELAAGQAPSYEDFSAVTVPLASGFPLAGPVKAAPVTAPVAEATPAPPLVVAAGGNRRMRA